MSDFDILALSQVTALLKSNLGVKVTEDWVPINENKVAFRLSLELKLINAKPTIFIPEFSSWGVVIDFENDKWGNVKIYPSLGTEAIKATFQHQLYNGGFHPVWPVRS
jgi:hypothetical protein